LAPSVGTTWSFVLYKNKSSEWWLVIRGLLHQERERERGIVPCKWWGRSLCGTFNGPLEDFFERHLCSTCLSARTKARMVPKWVPGLTKDVQSRHLIQVRGHVDRPKHVTLQWNGFIMAHCWQLSLWASKISFLFLFYDLDSLCQKDKGKRRFP
jgi:hypothetical protein